MGLLNIIDFMLEMSIEDIIYLTIGTFIVVVTAILLFIFFTAMFTADASKSFSAYSDKHTTKRGCLWSFLRRK